MLQPRMMSPSGSVPVAGEIEEVAALK